MAYLYQRRKNRYRRLPTQNSPYVTTNAACTEYDNDWDTQMPSDPTGYRNPLHNELHNLQPENVDQSANLLDNDPLSIGHNDASWPPVKFWTKKNVSEFIFFPSKFCILFFNFSSFLPFTLHWPSLIPDTLE